jgi:hypothetical protein
MKQLLVLAFLCFGMVAFAQTKDDVKFTAVKHTFGKIKQNVPATYVFTFKNASTSKPLIVESATAQCGCTTPEYPKTPIAKGKTGTIKVTYNAANPGAFTKTVTVKFANVAEPVVLTIDGEVQVAPK